MGYLAMALMQKTAANDGTAKQDTTHPPVPSAATNPPKAPAPGAAGAPKAGAAPAAPADTKMPAPATNQGKTKQNTEVGDNVYRPSLFGLNTSAGRDADTAAGDAGTLVPQAANKEEYNKKMQDINAANRFNKRMKTTYQEASKDINLGEEESLAGVQGKIKTNADRITREDIAKHRGTDMDEFGNAIRGEASPAETYARRLEAQRDAYANQSPEIQQALNKGSGPGVNLDASKMSDKLKQDINAHADPEIRRLAGGDIFNPRESMVNRWNTTPMDASVNEEKDPRSYANRVLSEKAYGGDPGTPGRTPATPGFTQQMTEGVAGVGDKTKAAVQTQRDAAFNKYAPWVAGGVGLLGGMGLMSMMGNMGGGQQGGMQNVTPEMQEYAAEQYRQQHMNDWAKTKNWGNFRGG